MIQIDQPEIESLIEQRMRTGGYRSVEEVLLHALRADQVHIDPTPPATEPKTLVQLFLNSPFAGLDIDCERDSDPGRDIDL